MYEKRNAHKFLVANLKERHHLEDLGTDMSMILKWILKKWDWRMWTECGSGQKPVAGSCENNMNL